VRRLLWILLTILTVVLVALVAQNGGAIPALANVDLPSLVLKVGAVVFVGALALAMFREQFSRAIESALIWVVVALLLAISYAYRYELHEVADRVMTELVPSHTASRTRAVWLVRDGGGHFELKAQLNGARINMILDTGATSVLLTQEDAKAVGLPIEVLAYTVSIDTANGRTRAAAVTLDRVLVGGIEERSIPALIAQPGQLRTSLLGMTFLNRLESWEVRGERLVMRGYP
jgi:aspartyl protease family protein